MTLSLIFWILSLTGLMAAVASIPQLPQRPFDYDDHGQKIDAAWASDRVGRFLTGRHSYSGGPACRDLCPCCYYRILARKRWRTLLRRYQLQADVLAPCLCREMLTDGGAR